MYKKLAIAVLFLFCVSFGYSQDTYKWTVDVGGGVSPLTGAISDRLDTGWNFTVSGGYNFNSYFSSSLRYTYNGLGVNRFVLDQAAVPDGNARVWSITLDPKIRFSAYHRVAPYVVGGVGFFRRTVEFTRPTFATTILFDPIFGFIFPAIVRVDQVIGRITRSGVGGNLGAGFEIGIGHQDLKFFTEARYQYADTGRIPTRMVPVTFGLRW